MNAAKVTLLKKDFDLWCEQHSGWARLPFLFLFFYLFVQHVADLRYTGLFGGLNLGIHEVGHLLFTPLGEFWHFLGGTIFQLFVPLYGVFNFLYLRDYFSIFLCFGWLSTNFFNVAAYAADARTQTLPLVTPFGGHARHDWHYMLSKLGLLEFDQIIAGLFLINAWVSMGVCLAGGLMVILKMENIIFRYKKS